MTCSNVTVFISIDTFKYLIPLLTHQSSSCSLILSSPGHVTTYLPLSLYLPVFKMDDVINWNYELQAAGMIHQEVYSVLTVE